MSSIQTHTGHRRAWSAWMLIARWVALDMRRSRGVAAIIVLCGLVALVAVILPTMVVEGELMAREALVFLVAPLKLVIALIGLLAGHGVIAGARSRGQLTLLLSLPITRTAIVVGAFIGVASIMLVGVTIAILTVSIVSSVVFGDLPWRELAVLGALLGCFGLAITAVAVGVSAAASTRGRAAIVVVSTFVLFEFFWGIVPAGLYYLFEGTLPGTVVPAWVVLLERLQPLSAFEATATAVLPAVQDSVQVSPDGATVHGTAGPRSLAARLESPPPGYLGPRAGVATLIAWTILPLAAGWGRFRRADL